MIKIIKNLPNTKPKEYPDNFNTFEEAEIFVKNVILPQEVLYKHVSFVLKNIPNVKKVRVYMFLDDEEDTEVYSYKIIEQ